MSYVNNWMWQHCSRVVHGLHCYVVHVLTTAYRNGKALLSKEQPQPHLEIPTPVLERADCFDQPQTLLPVSYVWLLSTTLPQCYLQVISIWLYYPIMYIFLYVCTCACTYKRTYNHNRNCLIWRKTHGTHISKLSFV